MKQKISQLSSSLLALCLVLALLPGTVLAEDSTGDSIQFAGGCGTSSDPYQIATAEQLNAIRYNTSEWNNYYVLINDIDLSVYKNWVPIDSFSGSLDGNGKTIRNLSIQSVDEKRSYVGLFGSIEYGKLNNINLDDVDICVTTSDRIRCGAIAGSFYSVYEVTNCHVTGSILVSSDNGYSSVGGIFGEVVGPYNSGHTIKDCHNECDISAPDAYVGGIIGYSIGEYASSRSLNVINCSNTGQITGRISGGIIGYGQDYLFSSTQLKVEKAYNSGRIIGRSYAGGIVGNFEYSSYGSHVFYLTIKDSYNCGKISGGHAAGGIAGYSKSSHATISNCYNIGGISADSYSAGILGYINGTTEIENCYYTNASKGDHPDSDVEESSQILSLSDFLDSSNLNGFDFVNTWTMQGNETYPYPELIDNEYSGIWTNDDDSANDNSLNSVMFFNSWNAETIEHSLTTVSWLTM